MFSPGSHPRDSLLGSNTEENSLRSCRFALQIRHDIPGEIVEIDPLQPIRRDSRAVTGAFAFGDLGSRSATSALSIALSAAIKATLANAAGSCVELRGEMSDRGGSSAHARWIGRFAESLFPPRSPSNGCHGSSYALHLIISHLSPLVQPLMMPSLAVILNVLVRIWRPFRGLAVQSARFVVTWRHRL